MDSKISNTASRISAQRDDARRTIKDSVFRNLFFQKEYLLWFARMVDEQRKLYPGDSRKAVTEAIRFCKDRNVLKAYLENREKEVVDIMVTLYSQEEAVEQYVISKQFESEIKSAVCSCRDFEKTIAEAISYLTKRFGFSAARAQREVEKYWNV